jgi:hypothetical protein
MATPATDCLIGDRAGCCPLMARSVVRMTGMGPLIRTIVRWWCQGDFFHPDCCPLDPMRPTHRGLERGREGNLTLRKSSAKMFRSIRLRNNNGETGALAWVNSNRCYLNSTSWRYAVANRIYSD